ncbi:MAG: methyltransferase, partial [Deltaproteobacteria bacterium]|nr:methyltransferase [Deltaproteobacteria bacterium]
IVPFDFNVCAEALGSKVQYYKTEDILYPSIPEKIIKSFEDIKLPSDPENAGRFPVVMEAIRILKKETGNDVAVGSWVLGPFTLAGQVTDLTKLLKDTFKKPNEVIQFLTPLRDLLISEAKLYQKAGADFITVREMGTPVDLLSPRVWKSMIQPFMIKMREEIGSPVVLHICGKTNEIIHFMHECGYDAVSVEHQNDVAMSRQKIGPPPKNLLLGNLNTYKVMVQGTAEDVANEVRAAIDGGVDAIWPGCDIWPGTPAENMKAMVDTTREYGSKKKKGG